MKITAQQLLVLADSGILGQLSNEKLAPRAMFRLDRLISIIQPEALRVQNARNALITEEISVTENGQRQVKPECVPQFLAAVQPILEEELDLPFRALTVEDLDGIRLSRNERVILGVLLAEPPEA